MLGLVANLINLSAKPLGLQSRTWVESFVVRALKVASQKPKGSRILPAIEDIQVFVTLQVLYNNSKSE